MANFELINEMIMNEHNFVFLPGGMKQFRILKSKFIFDNKSVLIIGTGSGPIAEKMVEVGAAFVRMIVDDYESLISTRLGLSKTTKVDVKMMDFDNTDYPDEQFDLIYAQASVSSSGRNKIIKELKRLLRADGIFCVSEITSLKSKFPAFVRDIFDSSDILPLEHERCSEYYKERKFEILFEEDLSSSLRSFYETATAELKENVKNLSEKDRSYYKKMLNKISHESNAYLKLGADKFIGFKMLILKKL